MSKNAVLRIVLWSLVLVILVGILVMGLGAFRIFNRSDEPDLQHYERGITTDGTFCCEFAAEDIRKLEIEWVSGDIILQSDDTADTVRVLEEYTADTKNQLVYKRSGNTLTIQFCEDSISFPSFGFNYSGDINKDLTILVPSDWICEELEIVTASANLLIRDVTIREVDFDGASGTCDFVNCTVDNLDIDTASGDVRFQGVLESLNFDAASASFYGELQNTPRHMEVDGASGDLELFLPEDSGFSVSVDGLSCKFSSDFPFEMKNGYYVHGDGSCKIDVDGMSSNVSIYKAK